MLELNGSLSDPNSLYSLHSGANLISYPFMGSALIDETVPEDAGQYITGIIGEGSAANHLPNGMWVGSLQNLEGGSGYWFMTSQAIDFSYNPPSGMARSNVAFEEFYDMPEEYIFTQSTRQAFYFIEDIENIDLGDIVIAYNDGIIVGSRIWGGSYSDIPSMGYDSDLNTAGYCANGDKVSFKVLKRSTGELFDIYAIDDQIPKWEDNKIFTLGSFGIIDIPQEVTLMSAYPNPFNPSTNIEFSIPIDMDVSISIYDMKGQQVDKLLDRKLTSGFHMVTWEANDFASGVYFIRLNTNEITTTQKLMLIK